MGIEHIYFIKGWDASTMRHGLKNNDDDLRAAMAMACGAPQPEKPDGWQAWCDGIARDLLDGVLRNVPLAHRPAADDVSRAIARRLWSKETFGNAAGRTAVRATVRRHGAPVCAGPHI